MSAADFIVAITKISPVANAGRTTDFHELIRRKETVVDHVAGHDAAEHVRIASSHSQSWMMADGAKMRSPSSDVNTRSPLGVSMRNSKPGAAPATTVTGRPRPA